MPPEVYGPRWAQRLGEALSSLRLLGGRAGLALLGIAVGCAAVVALLNVGHSAAMHSQQVFQGMGSELMIATLSATADTEEGPAQALVLTALPAAIRAAAPLAMASAEARLDGRSEALLAVGSSAALATVLGLSARHGRLFVEQDGHSPHVLLGATAARQLEAKVGDRLQVGRYLFEVIGVLAPHGYNPMLPVAVDDALLMPLAGMRRLASAAQVSAVLALARDAARLPDAAAALGDYLRAQLPRMAVEVQLPQQLLEAMARQSQVFTWLLAGLGGIALLVGGVGVMNVMIMNVSERRREIGVRMALGARPSDIAWLFLLEALLLAVAGALLGALVGLLAAGVFAWLSGWRLSLDPLSLPLGVGSSLLIGVFFGLQPALSAARLQPVTALRDE